VPEFRPAVYHNFLCPGPPVLPARYQGSSVAKHRERSQPALDALGTDRRRGADDHNPQVSHRRSYCAVSAFLVVEGEVPSCSLRFQFLLIFTSF